MRISDWSSDVCSSDLWIDCWQARTERAHGLRPCGHSPVGAHPVGDLHVAMLLRLSVASRQCKLRLPCLRPLRGASPPTLRSVAHRVGSHKTQWTLADLRYAARSPRSAPGICRRDHGSTAHPAHWFRQTPPSPPPPLNTI